MNKITLMDIKKRNITRLCHFTKSKNIPHILEEFKAIKSSDKIPSHYKDVNDILRLDGKKSHVCCSVEYPNLYYLDSIKNNDKLFKEWAILVINPEIIVNESCLFSAVNAATERGKYIKSGVEGFNSLYSNVVTTKRRTITRTSKLPSCCPTDFQGEIMIKEEIGIKYIEGIIVESEEQGRHEKFKLSLLGLQDKIKVYVSPEAFRKSSYEKLKLGIKPKEWIV